MDLRDSSLSLWASPVPSKKLDKLWKQKNCTVTKCSPKLHSARDIRERAAAAEEEKKLTALCMQSPHERSQADVQFICDCVSALVPFFQLWPENLQLALSRVLSTEVLVRQESVLARGTPCTRVVFVLSGKLSVLVPDDNGSSAHKQRAWDGAGRAVAAILKRGDACGEAALLGNNPMSHADVVVASRGAVLLSLKYEDFSRGLKEVLGLRQQDQLSYLRMHPLFAGVSLGDLDTLADALQLVHCPAGVLLTRAASALAAPAPGPARPASAHNSLAQHAIVFLLAEGCAAVRRGQGSGPGCSSPPVGASNKHLRSTTSSGLYDMDTVCLLQAMDVFGPMYLPPGTYVEAVTDMKLYCLTRADYDTLPPLTVKLLEEAQVFMSQYSAGKQQGLQRINAARAQPSYGGYHYKVGDVLLTSIHAGLGVLPPPGPPSMPASKSHKPPGAPVYGAGSFMDTSVAVPGKPAHSPSRPLPTAAKGPAHETGARLCASPVPLDVLHARQVITALDLCPHKDPRTGLPLPFSKAQGQRYEQERAHQQQQQQQQLGQGQYWEEQGLRKASKGAPGPQQHLSPQAVACGGPSWGGGLQTTPPAAVHAAGARPPTPPGPPQELHTHTQPAPPQLARRVPALPPASRQVAAERQAAASTTTTTFFLTQDPLQTPHLHPQHPPNPTAAPQLQAKFGPRPTSPKQKDHPTWHGALAGAPAAAADARSATVPRLPSLSTSAQALHASTAPLNVLPPSEKAWARVEVARRHVVETEPPRAQKVPITLRQRHAVIFSQAQQCAVSALRRKLSAADHSSDDEDAPRLDTKRQPSRRMSGDRRSSLERRSRESAHSAYDRQRKQAAAVPQQHGALLLQAGAIFGGGSGGTGGADVLASPRTVLSAASSALAPATRTLSGGSEWDVVAHGGEPMLVDGGLRSSGSGEAGGGGAEEGGPGAQARRRGTREGRRGSGSGEGLDLGPQLQRPEARVDVLEAGWMAGQQQQQPPQMVLEERALAGAGRLASREEHRWGPAQDGGGASCRQGGEGGVSNLGPGCAGAGQQAQPVLQQAPHTWQQHQQGSHLQHQPLQDALLPAAAGHQAQHARPQPGQQVWGHAGAGPQAEQQQDGRGGSSQGGAPGSAAGSSSMGGRVQEQEGSPRGGTGHGGLVEEALALPPSVMLGYETLDPFSMATLLSYASQHAGAADGMLPRPGW